MNPDLDRLLLEERSEVVLERFELGLLLVDQLRGRLGLGILEAPGNVDQPDVGLDGEIVEPFDPIVVGARPSFGLRRCQYVFGHL